MQLTESQQKVFNAAKKRLARKPWYRGVCCDDFPSDKECRENPEDAITAVEMQTALFDAPDFFSA